MTQRNKFTETMRIDIPQDALKDALPGKRKKQSHKGSLGQLQRGNRHDAKTIGNEF